MDVKEWLSVRTAEQDEFEDFEYLEPPAFQEISKSFESESSRLFFVYAVQGCGKTVMAQRLSLIGENESIYFKWTYPGNFYGQFSAPLERTFEKKYFDLLVSQIRSYIVTKPSLQRRLRSRIDKGKDRIEDEDKWNSIAAVVLPDDYSNFEPDPEFLLSLVPEYKRNELCRSMIPKLFRPEKQDDASGKNIVIDMPDYAALQKNTAQADMAVLSEFWNALIQVGWYGSMVVFVQKEIGRLHYWQGKGTRLEIKPFRPEELTDYYKRNFGLKPFNEESLLEIAKISGGIFRVFKMLVGHCVNQNRNIELSDLKEIINEDVQGEALEFSFRTMFRGDKERSNAVKIYRLMQAHGDWTQKQLSEYTGIRQDQLSLIQAMLRDNDYRY